MTTFKNNKDSRGDWETPSWMYKECTDYAGFIPDVDVAATEKNSLCEHYITKEIDMIISNWKDYGSIFWLNAPNSELSSMMLKSHNQWESGGMRGIVILPLQSIATKYGRVLWKEVERKRIRFRPIWRRPTFQLDGVVPILPSGKKATGSPLAYCMLVFDK